MDHNLIKLQELSNFLNEKYQMDTYIDKSSEVLFNTNYKLFVIKRVIYIVLLIFLYCYILSFKNKHIVLLLIKIIIILIIIFNLYILIINKLTKEHEEKINNHIRNNHTINNIENIEFKTGDVIQQVYYWTINDKMINLFYFQNNVHNLLIINFNNNIYALHYYPDDTLFWGHTVIKFKNNKHMEIANLYEYIKYEKEKYNTIYRLIKVENRLDNNKIFNIIKNNFNKKSTFTFLPSIKFTSIEDWYNNHFNKANCCSFIIKLLYLYGLIKLFNFNNVTSDDLLFLKYITNGVYQDPIYI